MEVELAGGGVVNVAAEALDSLSVTVGVEVGIDNEVEVGRAGSVVGAVDKGTRFELRAGDPGEGELRVEGVGVDSGKRPPVVGTTEVVTVGLVVVVGEGELLGVAIVILAPHLTKL